FGDIAGKAGGIDNFFGLDGASDVKIDFQVGVGNRLNILAARTRGDQSSSGDTSGSRFVSGNFIRVGSVQQLWELGLKYQFMKQGDNDPAHPISVTAFVNGVVSAMKPLNKTVYRERTFDKFSDRMSELVQLMIARRFGKISLQVTPTFLHTNFVI